MAFTSRTIFDVLKRDGVIKTGRALDLGCGIGIDAEKLSLDGFIVDAVDNDKKSLEKIKTSSSIIPIFSKIEDFKIQKDSYTLISAQYSLQFLPKNQMEEVIKNMTKGVISGGIITFNVIGEKDEWKDTVGKTWTTWTREEADKFISNLPVKVHKIITEEGMGMTLAGKLKYWHVINYVLIKV
ncbi:methyltransferase domain-containing protein [bacterium]|nr:methyltransferase domain-containing protein [bacterium]